MNSPDEDPRSERRKALDEQIASEPPRPIPEFPSDAIRQPFDVHSARPRRPLAVSGIVENGLVRPLDPDVKLPEHARVIIVAAGV